jgi:mycothiol synthase
MTSAQTPAADVAHVPDAPDIPGLTFRRFRGESDFAAIAAVIEGCKDADGIEWTTSVEDVAFNYTHLIRSDPFLDMVFAEVHGRVVGYSRVEWHQQAGGRRSYFLLGYLLPKWRRKGIGRAAVRPTKNRWHER